MGCLKFGPLFLTLEIIPRGGSREKKSLRLKLCGRQRGGLLCDDEGLGLLSCTQDLHLSQGPQPNCFQQQGSLCKLGALQMIWMATAIIPSITNGSFCTAPMGRPLRGKIWYSPVGATASIRSSYVLSNIRGKLQGLVLTEVVNL